MKLFNSLIILLFIISPYLVADEISGIPRITDGDTIKILNKRIRFYGIDTPEKKQICEERSR